MPAVPPVPLAAPVPATAPAIIICGPVIEAALPPEPAPAFAACDPDPPLPTALPPTPPAASAIDFAFGLAVCAVFAAFRFDCEGDDEHADPAKESTHPATANTVL